MTLWASPYQMEETIQPRLQAKSQLVTTYRQVPYQITSMLVSYEYRGQKVYTDIALPLTINKQFEFEPTSKSDFNELWSRHSTSTSRSSGDVKVNPYF